MTKAKETKAAEPGAGASAPAAPAWVDDMVATYREEAAHAFIVHGAVTDYVRAGHDLRGYLTQVFSDHVPVWFNPARGLSFDVGGQPPRTEMSSAVKADEETAAERNARRFMEAAFRGRPVGIDGKPLPLPSCDQLARDAASVLQLADRALHCDPRSAVDEKTGEEVPAPLFAIFIDYAEMVVPAGPAAGMSPLDRLALVTLLEWGRDAEISAAGHIVVLITRDVLKLSDDVRASSSRFYSVAVPLPDEGERRLFIDETLKTADRPPARLEVSVAQFARQTAGCTRYAIETIQLRAITRNVPVTAELIKTEKRSILQSEFGDVLQLIEPTFGFEATPGMDYMVDFFESCLIQPLRDGRLEMVPSGVLVMGRPGGGKTMFICALAWHCQMNVALLNPANLKGMYVGQSEQKLEKALMAIRSLAPIIVFIDEIDQRLRRGEEGDSGVGRNEFARILEAMSDPTLRGRVIWIAATNRPDLLDPALMRDGRFTKKILVDVPNAEGRRAIAANLADKYRLPLAKAECAKVADLSEGWTPAMMDSFMQIAAEEAARGATDAILQAKRRYRPRFDPNTEAMREAALREITDLQLLPPALRAAVMREVDGPKGITTPAPRVRRRRT